MVPSVVLTETNALQTLEASLVTLIAPVRNEADSLLDFLESIARQTVRPSEIIIADGGSVDGTKALIREFFAANSSVRLIEDSDAFPGRARNLAIENAQTDWIAMTDAGTVLEPDWLENLLRPAARDREVDAVLGSYEPILSSFLQECLALAFVPPARPMGDSYLRGPSTASLLIKKSVWNELGRFPEHLRACEDLIFFAKLNSASKRVAFAPRAVVRWNIPSNAAGVFRRFRAYSLYTLKAGLGRQWHLAVGRMYLVGTVLLGLAVFHHWGWLLLLLAGLVLRVHRTIRARRPSLKLTHTIGPHAYLVVGIILVWIDLAAFVGFVDYLFKGRLDDRNAFSENV